MQLTLALSHIFINHDGRQQVMPISKQAEALLLYADSERDSDMLYFGNIFVPDSFLAFHWRGKKYAVLNALEIDRARETSDFHTILPQEEIVKAARKQFRRAVVSTSDIVRYLAQDLKIPKFIIPANFPAEIALELHKHKIKLQVRDPLFPKRLIKTASEQEALREGNKASAAGLKAAYDVLRRATIKGHKLYLNNKILTAEYLRQEIDIACLLTGARAAHTIVACGSQACDPHCEGSGPISPHELIIIDVFPRNSKSGYHGDMTRTFLKGRASEAQKKLMATVREAQRLAINKIKAGVNSKHAHAIVVKHFEANGYETGIKNGRHIGFFHSTGHGLGLDVHEAPRISSASAILKKGMVVTVEPGLYYPSLGGCRIEDVVAVSNRKAQLLCTFHYKWLIT